ncbi:MAG: DsrE family protein [Proteobacteria bacterium]|nr:DsrE family protein [Pseudomonadota bacterium]
MASAAAATDRRVTLFFTGRAVAALVDATGWHVLDAKPEGAAARDATWRQRGVGGFEELLTACRDLGVRLIVCEMALRAASIAGGTLRTDLELETAGVVTFLNAAAGGAIVFI